MGGTEGGQNKLYIQAGGNAMSFIEVVNSCSPGYGSGHDQVPSTWPRASIIQWVLSMHTMMEIQLSTAIAIEPDMKEYGADVGMAGRRKFMAWQQGDPG